MEYLKKTIFSYWFTIVSLLLLGIGAGVATFIENDYGTQTARVVVYNHFWYEAVLVLACLNILGIIYLRKMWKKPSKFILHLSFVVILIGAAMTRYFGFEGIMNIREGQGSNQMLSLESYFIVDANINGKNEHFEFPLAVSAFGKDFTYDFVFSNGKKLVVKSAGVKFAKKGKAEMNILKVNASMDGKEELMTLVGTRGVQGMPMSADLGGTIVTLSYGSKIIDLPFSIALRDFELQRYPGSMSPSSYASEVTVIDEAKGQKYDFRIFMNNTLEHGNYKFFQSSFDPDEMGTVLSVNNDPGKIPTYVGYFLLTLGFLWVLFDQNSRFWKLSKYVKASQSLAIALLLFVSSGNLMANTDTDNVNYLNDYKEKSAKTAEEFGKLIVQDFGGRMKPLNTLNTEIVAKITKKSEFLGMTPDQMILGMLVRPDIWKDVRIVKITTPKLKKELGVAEDQKYISFSDVFTPKNEYKLEKLVNEANAVKVNERGTFEKDILQVDERMNIVYMVFSGNIFRIFPDPASANNVWLNPTDAIMKLQDPQRGAAEILIKGYLGSLLDGKYDAAKDYQNGISNYQKKLGSAVYPDEQKIAIELWVNKIKPFNNLTFAYLIVGFLMFVYAFATVFKPSVKNSKVDMMIVGVAAILFLAHTSAMGVRWYISGHAPWSDTYESLIYISWSAIFGGIIFFRNNMLALSAATIMTAIFMFTANLTNIDPQITNLVPVLKSYWLTIHVSIITGSYGFLAIGAMLGFMSLILFIFRNNRPHIDKSILQITAINEMALIIGLAFLTIGNFIGGVWANESWGRYWGWDPKETWAYVSIVFYAAVIHLRFIKKLDNPFVMSTASLLAFSSILMTYFGVNFYLSGMHSYATGDPVPVPTWVYVCVAIVFASIALAWRNRKLEKINFNKNSENQ